MTVVISADPVLHFVDSNGNALTGGKLFTYAGGTTTKLNTYTDSTGATPNTNPIILNSRGEAQVWVTAGTAYKFVLAPSTDTDPPTNPIWTVDNITLQSAVTQNVTVPTGRLTLISATPVMVANETAKTSVFYTPYIGNQVPIYNGTQFVNTTFTELTLALDSNTGHTGYQASGSLFDLFLFLNSGTLTLATGPAWTNSTTRSNAITQLGGLWVNNASIVLKIDATSTTVTCSANQALYVGTMYATANGQTGMNFVPAPANGGTANILGLYNAYNRVRSSAKCADNTASWTYGTATWRPSDNSTSNRISWVDGLQQSFVLSRVTVETQASNSQGQVAINLDSTTATPTDATAITQSASSYVTLSASADFFPQLGFHFAQAMEYSTLATHTFYGAASGSGQSFMLSLTVYM